MAKAKIMMTKPMIAKVNLPLAAPADSGLPLEVINWIPEMIINITVMKPAIPRMMGRIWEIRSVTKVSGVNPGTWESGS